MTLFIETTFPIHGRLDSWLTPSPGHRVHKRPTRDFPASHPFFLDCADSTVMGNNTKPKDKQKTEQGSPPSTKETPPLSLSSMQYQPFLTTHATLGTREQGSLYYRRTRASFKVTHAHGTSVLHYAPRVKQLSYLPAGTEPASREGKEENHPFNLERLGKPSLLCGFGRYPSLKSAGKAVITRVAHI